VLSVADSAVNAAELVVSRSFKRAAEFAKTCCQLSTADNPTAVA